MLIKTSKLLFFLIFVSCTSSTETDVKINKVEQPTNIHSNSSSLDDTPKEVVAVIDKNTSITEPNNIKEDEWIIAEDSEWYPLYQRLKNDGIHGKDIDNYFKNLEGQYSQKPMGIKVKELYRVSFQKRTPQAKQVKDTSPNTTGIPRPWYKDYVTEANAQKCRNFIIANQEIFSHVEKKYNIPADIISALIYIETWHGNYLGKYNPLINLASMANSTKIEQIPTYIKELPLAKEKNAWILGKMEEKANWSYKELKALLMYCRENKIDPLTLPSSVYGALGYGQFMPTNIPHYAVDGNNDGVIDLFNPSDGIASVANFLYKHGWNKTHLTLPQQTKVLKRYNHSTVYANTILALATVTSRIGK